MAFRKPEPTIKDNLDESYVIDSITNCWIWKHFKNPEGYGQFHSMRNSRDTTIMAHVGVYEFYRGKLPIDLSLDHKCRNKSCVNPEHLEPVTIAINTQRGKSAKMTPDQVRQMRKLREEGAGIERLGRMFNLSISAVSKIIRYESWKNV